MQQLRTSFSTDLAIPSGLTAEVRWLLAEGVITSETALSAQREAREVGANLGAVLLADHNVSERDLAQARANALGAALIDLDEEAADPALLAAFNRRTALHNEVLPWRKVCNVTIVLCARPELFHLHLPVLRATFGEVRMAIATASQIRSHILASYATELSKEAEKRVAAEESCRNWRSNIALAGLGVFTVMLTAVIALNPSALLAAATIWAVVVLGALAFLNLAALIASRKTDEAPAVQNMNAKLPCITILVPLFKESSVIDHLIHRLSDLDYPRSLLDICLVMEEEDQVTQAQVSQTKLPQWVRTMIVPKGVLQTKPRALNYALDTARGEIIGIYDAEDAPDSQQLRVVAQHFAAAPKNTACLQGTLDYYNPRANWLTRCFTIEYASWFRVVLPGYEKLGLAVPLGGTTLFFKRSVLEKLGGWDAHNVTEDADLGLRLARWGYRTDFIPTVTEEEANGHAWPWVRQRSRWLKGYAMTYAVHMSRPLKLWRNLGLWRFMGVQLLFLGTLTQFVLAPLLWSFWLIPFGGHHPLTAVVSHEAIIACTAICVFSAAVNLSVQALGVIKAGKRWLIPWSLTMMFYFPLGTLAVYKGLIELVWKPFFWDKTQHGKLMPKARLTPPLRPQQHPVSDGSYTLG